MCKLYVGALLSEHQTNQSSSKIQENQNEIHVPNSSFIVMDPRDERLLIPNYYSVFGHRCSFYSIALHWCLVFCHHDLAAFKGWVCSLLKHERFLIAVGHT